MYSTLLEELSRAVGARLIIQFSYNGITYEVEPHLLGRDMNNQDCLCAWLTNVSGKETDLNGWRCFLLQDIRDLRALEQRFCHTRPGYKPYDDSMTRIYYRT
ncbi:hypothetical protein ACFSKU_09775 [Pontibacter silvestris]|uniref:WYL domain-containing protein n=2 Tax=Pontibacter silvestris TaxID=2305183 RepID=A0ABW4WZP3_9BACT